MNKSEKKNQVTQNVNQKKKYVSPRVTLHSKKDDQEVKINACASFTP